MSVVTTKEVLVAVQEGFEKGSVLKNGVRRVSFPWDGVQLTKAERKGKTGHEIQDMRRARWIAAQPKNDIEYKVSDVEISNIPIKEEAVDA